jgi:hypothetical protein
MYPASPIVLDWDNASTWFGVELLRYWAFAIPPSAVWIDRCPVVASLVP